MENFESLPTHTRIPLDGSLENATAFNPTLRRHIDGKETGYVLEKGDGAEQFITSQIASLILNVANIYPYKSTDGAQHFISPNIEEQHNYDVEKNIRREDALLFGLLFGDLDHLEDENHGGGVFYDFGTSDMTYPEEEYQSRSRTNHTRSYFHLDSGIKRGTLNLEYMLSKCNDLLSYISGESGLHFISALCKKADFTSLTPEELQARYISVTNKTLERLSSGQPS